MSSFSFGQILQGARERKGLTIQAVADATKIKPAYIELLESDAIEKMPSLAQARGFTRAYAAFLGLDTESLLSSLAGRTPSDPDALPPSSAGPSGASAPDAILAEIGAVLVRQRELLGLSPAEAAEHTRIPEHYLVYMESGRFAEFPSSVQARGMLGSYAAFLQADDEALLLRFAEALQARLIERQSATSPRLGRGPEPKRKPQLPSRLSRHVSGEVVWMALAAVVIIGLVIVVVGQVMAARAEFQSPPTAPALVLALLPSPTPVPTASPEVQTSPSPAFSSEIDTPGEITPTLPPAGQSQIQVFLIVTQRTYLKVTVDGRVAFDGRALPGANLPYGARESVEVIVGNGAGVQAFYNQQDLGLLGLFGEVVHILFHADGVVTPTPAATATPTPPPATPTLAPAP